MRRIYILYQVSEYHSFAEDVSYYDYFPVSGAQEADELNRLYSGMEIEAKFPKKYLACTRGQFGWLEGFITEDKQEP